jgi:hypothetical protein
MRRAEYLPESIFSLLGTESIHAVIHELAEAIRARIGRQRPKRSKVDIHVSPVSDAWLRIYEGEHHKHPVER